MPQKRKVRGGSLWSWIKDTAVPWIKKNKLISRGAAALGGILPGGYGMLAKGASAGASTLGWGKRPKGGSFLSALKKGHTFVKNNRLISKGAFGLHKLTGNDKFKSVGQAAHALGYGVGYNGGALGYSRGAGRKLKKKR